MNKNEGKEVNRNLYEFELLYFNFPKPKLYGVRLSKPKIRSEMEKRNKNIHLRLRRFCSFCLFWHFG